MSIARALTTVRRVRGTSNEETASPIPTRAGTLKKTDFRFVDRAKISLPVNLISTTNALAYDAPDIPRPGNVAILPNVAISPSLSSSSSSSRKSFDGSESGASTATSISTPGLSREGSPVLDINHKSYFPLSPTGKSFLDLNPITPLSATFKEIEIPPTTPAVPTRALSHTKSTHQALARQRSLSRMSGSRLSGEVQSTPSSRAVSTEVHMNTLEEHPFGAELAKVMEVAEEFGVKDVGIWDEEEQFLVDSGFGRFSADDYISEIQPLFGKAFFDTPVSNIPLWL